MKNKYDNNEQNKQTEQPEQPEQTEQTKQTKQTEQTKQIEQPEQTKIKIKNVFAFASGGFKGIYSMGIWDALLEQMINSKNEYIGQKKFMFTGSSIGSFVATKAYKDIYFYQKEFKQNKSQSKIQISNSVKDSHQKYNELIDNIVEKGNSSKLIKIFTDSNYCVYPIWLVLKGLLNILLGRGYLFNDTAKNKYIDDIIVDKDNNKNTDWLSSRNLSLRLAATDILSGKIISFEKNFNEDNGLPSDNFNNESIIYTDKLNFSNINKILYASSSIPLIFPSQKCYLTTNNTKIEFDESNLDLDNTDNTELFLFDGGASTDMCIGSLVDTIETNKNYSVDKIILFDVVNYYKIFNKQTTKYKPGIINIVSKLIDSYSKYVKYNDLLEAIITYREKIIFPKTVIDNGKEIRGEENIYNYLKKQNKNDYIYMVNIISDTTLEDITDPYTKRKPTVTYYKLDKKYININLNEIIYIGGDIATDIPDVILNQDNIKTLSPYLYKHGKYIATQIFKYMKK